MSDHPCCDIALAASRPRGGIARSSSIHRRAISLGAQCRSIAKWLLPTAILALMPKCPLCLASYVALGTGIGLSVGAATYVRIGLVTLCAASLSYLAARHLRDVIVVRSGAHG